jgi:ribosomal protein L28
MKKSIITMKPNIKRRTLRSEILNYTFPRVTISMKARKCIMKAGSLDKYLINTKKEDIDSKWGLHIKNLILKKQKYPDMEIRYILGSAKM